MGAFPVFNLEVEEGRYYGFPSFLVPGFKFGKYHHLGEQVDPDTVDREPQPKDEELLRAFAQRYFPEGAGPTLMLKGCLFTNSPDRHFILDLHPEHPEVAIAAGFSGHGYKFCSVVGEIMADLAERGETGHDIEFFRLARFGIRRDARVRVSP
jgi:sarcosine oxidase